jgi:hypothetical protein
MPGGMTGRDSYTSWLPQELCDAIIEFYQDDTQTLRTLALVNRRWLETCRAYLFTDVRVDCRKRTPEAIYELVTLLPAISHHVRCIRFAGYIQNQALGNVIIEPDRLMFKQLGFMLPIIGSNITKLVFTQCALKYDYSDALAPPLREDVQALFSRVQTLHLHSVDFGRFTLLHWYINLFTSLQELQLDNPNVYGSMGVGLMVSPHKLMMPSPDSPLTMKLGLDQCDSNVDQDQYAFDVVRAVAPALVTAQEVLPRRESLT